MTVLHEKCYVCGQIVDFEIDDSSVLFREAVCPHCGSSIRHSDVAQAVSDYFSSGEPLAQAVAGMQEMRILNTSPLGESYRLLSKLSGCVGCEYFPDVLSGEMTENGILCVDLTNIPFPSNTFDLVITEEVLEHISDLEQALSEISRVLKPGGVHIFTIPVCETILTRSISDLNVTHPAAFDGDSKVFHEFGLDIANILVKYGFSTRYRMAHRFCSSDQTTDLRRDYTAYCEISDKPLEFFRYNSIVFTSEKVTGINGAIERIDLQTTEYSEVVMEHLHRYQSVLDLVEGKTVLDAACGSGYGTKLLAEKAKKVVGIDIDAEVITRLRKEEMKNTSFQCMSVEEMDFENNSFDVVVSFETIEHIDEAAQNAFLAEIRRVLKPDGYLIISTPNVDVLKAVFRDYYNPFHVKEHTREEFFALLKPYFKYIQEYYQNVVEASCISSTLESVPSNPINADNGKYLIAVCSDCALPKNLLRSAYFPAAEMYYRGLHRTITSITEKANLYIDSGTGFREEDIVTVECSYQKGYFHITFDCSGYQCIRTLRFDPLEGAPCRVNISSCCIDGIQCSIEAINATEQYESVDYFFHTDPQYLIQVPGKGITKVEVEGYLDYRLSKRVIQIYELCRNQEICIIEKDRAFQKMEQELTQQCEEVRCELTRQREEIRQELTQQLIQAQYDYNVISNAFFWKITKPARVITDALKSLLKKNRYTWLFCKGLKCLKQNGFSYTWRRVQDKLCNRQDYSKALNTFTPEELERQKKDVFPQKIKFSILVPLYNTPERFLREMIQSVLDQTYGDWELCMADGSDGQRGEVEKICRQYARKDVRVQYKKLEKNLGISENTNACIEMATGDYIALLDHDDLLHPAALHEVMRAICEQDADFIYTDEATFESPNVNKIVTAHFKPDFAIDNLRANNYICHFSAFARTVLDQAGYFRAAYDGSQDHDIMLRLTAKAKRVVHIPRVLYYWRSHSQSVAMDISSKEYAINAGKKAVKDSVAQLGDIVDVTSSRAFPTIYRLKYVLKGCPKISIIIPTKDQFEILQKCINSILSLTTYPNYEIVIVDNGSTEPAVLRYYDELKDQPKFVICSLDIEFNYSRLNNYGAQQATGEYYVLLNNDTEIITPEWIEEMLMYVQRDDVGAAGAMLYYPDNTIQHAGIILGLGKDRVAGHAFYRCERGTVGYMGRLCYAQNMAAVTAACMMVKASVYQSLGGLDESFAVAYNDVDFCMRIRNAGYLIVWTPYAELYHYESKTRGYDDKPEKKKRFFEEALQFKSRWAKELEAGDPYYNPNFTLDREDFSLR